MKRKDSESEESDTFLLWKVFFVMRNTTEEIISK